MYNVVCTYTAPPFLQDTKDTIKVANRITPDDRSQPSVTVSDNCISQTVTVFGPIKKFRPVICRSVEKETSLHSSLMEAIQTGGGKDRLKKVRRGTVHERREIWDKV